MVLNFAQGQDSTPTNTNSYLQAHVHTPFNQMQAHAPQWGTGAMREFISGINSSGPQVSQAASELAKRVEEAFRRELGINSPSRVLAELGQFSALGFVQGLSDVDMDKFAKKQLDALLATFAAFNPNFGGQFRMTSGFGPRSSPGGIGSTNHRGVDFAAPMGTPIRAQAGGMVNFAGVQGGYGNIVRITGAGGLEYLYAHNSANLVRQGQMVSPGQIIGLVGSTGNSTGPHVHYEVRRNGSAINPMGGHINAFARGGIVDNDQLARIGEGNKREVVIPLERYRNRALGLLSYAQEELGVQDSLGSDQTAVALSSGSSRNKSVAQVTKEVILQFNGDNHFHNDMDKAEFERMVTEAVEKALEEDDFEGGTYIG